jgi:hypothetical protein
MMSRLICSLALILAVLSSGGCRKAQQPDQLQQPTKATEASASDQSTSPSQADKQRPQPEPAEKQSLPPEKHSQPQRLNPAFPYPDGYKPEIRLSPPPVPPEIVGPSPPIKR